MVDETEAAHDQKLIEAWQARREAAKPTSELSKSFMDRMASSVIDPTQPIEEKREPEVEPLMIFRP